MESVRNRTKKVLYRLVFVLCQSAKVHVMDRRISTFGDYTFYGFKHFVLRQFEEGREKVNEGVLNGFVAGAIQVGCDF